MSLELYLIRHGIAADRDDYADDKQRPLTEKGYRKTQKVAKQLRDLDIQFDLILTSPLLRARQTAQILQIAALAKEIKESTSLAPDGNIQNWIDWLEKWRSSSGSRLALVGHQPDLGNWAEILVWGESRERLILKKAGIIGLLVPDRGNPMGQSELFWLTSPKLFLH